MARIRTVKPEFWTDERVGECSPTARLLFIASWNFADDHGGLDRSAKQLKAQAFPYDVIDCEPLVQELIAVGLFIEYEVGGKKYLHIKGFGVHQKIEKQGKPRVPLYESSPSTPRIVDESSPSEGKGKGKGKGKGSEKTRAAREPTRGTSFPDDFSLSPDLAAKALARYPDADASAMFEQFRAHHTAHGSTMKSWSAAWTTWLGNAERFGYPKRQATARKWD